MFPTLSLGPLSVQTPGLILLMAVYLGLWLAEKSAPRFNIQPDALYNLTFYAFLGALLSGRLFFVLQNLAIFLQTPLSLFSLNPALISLPAAFFGALLAAWIYMQKQKLPLWDTLDAMTPALAVIALGSGLMNLASGKAFGAPTTLPWSITLWGEARHPTQIYALLAAAIVLAYLLATQNKERPAGVYFLQFSALTAGWALIVSAFRGDAILWPGGIRQEEVIAWAVMSLSLWLLNQRESAHG